METNKTIERLQNKKNHATRFLDYSDAVEYYQSDWKIAATAEPGLSMSEYIDRRYQAFLFGCKNIGATPMDKTGWLSFIASRHNYKGGRSKWHRSIC